MQIRKATNNDVHQILKLKAELGEHMEITYLKEKNKLQIKKRAFYKKSEKLSIQAKALLSTLLGRYLETKKQKFNLDNLQKVFKNYCKWWLIEVKNFSGVVNELHDSGFVEKSKSFIYLKVPYEEAYPIESKLRKILDVDNRSKKWKLEKGITYFIHLVVEEKGEIIGYLSGFLISDIIGGEGELSELVISKKARGKGFGTKLVKEFLKIAEKKGINYIQLTTSKENKKAIEFYKKCGFEKSKQIWLSWRPYK